MRQRFRWRAVGAISITTLMAMPRAQGLFHQAVTQSGADAQILTAEAAARVASMLAQSFEVAPTREALSKVPVERLGRASGMRARGLLDGPGGSARSGPQ